MKQLKNNIKALIKEKGKTQEEVASALGIKQNTLSEKLGKNENIKFQTISDIADILEIPIIDIITYPDKYVKEVKKCEKCEELSLQIKRRRRWRMSIAASSINRRQGVSWLI